MSTNTNAVRTALRPYRNARVGFTLCRLCDTWVDPRRVADHLGAHTEALYPKPVNVIALLPAGTKRMDVLVLPSTSSNVTTATHSAVITMPIIPRFAVAALIRTPVGVASWPVLDTQVSGVDRRRWVSVNISTQPGKVMPKWYLESELIALNPAVETLQEAQRLLHEITKLYLSDNMAEAIRLAEANGFKGGDTGRRVDFSDLVTWANRLPGYTPMFETWQEYRDYYREYTETQEAA